MSYADDMGYAGLEDLIPDEEKYKFLHGSDFDIDSTDEVEFISIPVPAWRTRDNRLIAIKDMDTSHIRNCIRMILSSKSGWRSSYLSYFKYEKYIVYDTTDNPVGIPFNTWEDAETYKIVYGRPDWTIKLVSIHIHRNSTLKQKRAVEFVESILEVEFKGDLNDFYEVSRFLNLYLDTAKTMAEDALQGF